jgi:hypothetical protein
VENFTTINQLWDAGTLTISSDGSGTFTAKNTALTNCIMPSTGSASAGEPCNGVGP